MKRIDILTTVSFRSSDEIVEFQDNREDEELEIERNELVKKLPRGRTSPPSQSLNEPQSNSRFCTLITSEWQTFPVNSATSGSRYHSAAPTIPASPFSLPKRSEPIRFSPTSFMAGLVLLKRKRD